MKVDIPYGKGDIAIDLPEPFEVLVPNKVSIEDEDKLIEEKVYELVEHGAEHLLGFHHEQEN